MSHYKVSQLSEQIHRLFLAKIRDNRDEYEGVSFNTKQIARLLAVECSIAIMKNKRDPYDDKSIVGGWRRPVEYHIDLPSGRKKVEAFYSYAEMMSALEILRGGSFAARKKVERQWRYTFYEKPTDTNEIQRLIYKKEDEEARQRAALKEASKLLERAGIKNAIVEHPYGLLSLDIPDTHGRDFLAFLRRGLGK